jgi:hypothetical protein
LPDQKQHGKQVELDKDQIPYPRAATPDRGTETQRSLLIAVDVILRLAEGSAVRYRSGSWGTCNAAVSYVHNCRS